MSESVENVVNHENVTKAREPCSTAATKDALKEGKCDISKVSNTQQEGRKRPLAVLESSSSDPANANKRVQPASISAVKDMTDICKISNLKDGDRIEVHWDVQDDGSKTMTRWWGAKLLPHDGRVHVLEDEDSLTNVKESVTVPLRVLLYDSYKEGGYPEKTKVDVAFVSDRLVFDLSMQCTCCWRKQGSDWEPNSADLVEATADDDSAVVEDTRFSTLYFDGSQGAMEEIIDGVIARALVTVSAQFRLLDAVQQRYFASSVNDAKTKFVHQMMVECAETKEITPEHVARCMNVVKTQLNRAKEESSA